jgi:hypothetical protein
LFFLAYYFIKETFSPVTVGFVGRFDHFRHSALLVFTKTVWVEPIPQQSTGRIPVGIPVENLLRWIGFDCRDLMPWE